MRRTSVLALAMMFCPTLFATITKGTAVTGQNTNATTVATSAGITTGVNSLILVGVAYSNSSSVVSSIAASGGSGTVGPFTQVYVCSPKNNASFELWQANSTTGLTGVTLTATFNFSTYATITAESWTGTTTTVGNSNCATAANGTTFNNAIVTSSGHNNSIYVQWISSANYTTTFTASSGMTLDVNIVLNLKLNVSDYTSGVISPAATQTLTGSQTSLGHYTNSGVELKDAGITIGNSQIM